MQILRYVSLLILWLTVGYTTAQGTSQAVYPSGAGVSAGYHFSPSTVPVTDTLFLEQWLVNRGTGEITGLYFTFQLPSGMTPIGRWAEVEGTPVPFSIERSSGPGALSTWRLVLDSPTGAPDTRLQPGDSAHVLLPVRIAAAGQYAVQVLGATFAIGGEARFAVNGQEPIVINAVGGSCCVMRGDVDGGGSITVADLTYLVNLLFRSGPSAPCPEEADINGLGGLGITVTDLTYLVNLLFRSGSQPPPCQ